MVQPGKLLVLLPKLYEMPAEGQPAVSPQVIAVTILESDEIKFRAQDVAKVVSFGVGDTVYIPENAGQQFMLDNQPVAAIYPGDIFYHKAKK